MSAVDFPADTNHTSPSVLAANSRDRPSVCGARIHTYSSASTRSKFENMEYTCSTWACVLPRSGEFCSRGTLRRSRFIFNFRTRERLSGTEGGSDFPLLATLHVPRTAPRHRGALRNFQKYVWSLRCIIRASNDGRFTRRGSREHNPESN